MKRLIPLLLLLVACNTTRITKNNQQYIAKYNASVQANRMYEVMKQGNRSYQASAADYTSIADQIQWFTAIDSLRPHGNKMYRQDTLLRNSWNEKAVTHKAKGTLTISQVSVNQAYIKRYFDAMIEPEKYLKP